MKQMMIRSVLLITVVAFTVSMLAKMALAQEERKERTTATQAGRLEVGSAVGLQAGTADDTVLGLLLNGDYYLDRSLSAWASDAVWGWR